MLNALSSAEVFAELPPGLPQDYGVHHTTDTGTAPLVSQTMYRLRPKKLAEVQDQVTELLDKGLIQPSYSRLL